MTTRSSGIQLIPPPPSRHTGFLDDSNNWADVLAYRNQLVESRNAQLEYQENVSQLHLKIRRACQELTKKGNGVKEEIEVLALEKGRLAYLRDELARRADMISRWEARVRESDPTWVPRPQSASAMETVRKEQDRFNAMLVEIDQKRHMASSDGYTSNIAGQVDTVPPTATVPVTSQASSSGSSYSSSSYTGTPSSSSSAITTPAASASGSSIPHVTRPGSVHEEPTPQRTKSAAHELPPVSPISGPNSIDISASTSGAPRQAPVPYTAPAPAAPTTLAGRQVGAWDAPSQATQTANMPYATESRYLKSQFDADMTVCLDYLWREYSTELNGSNGDRLMTLPNLMRLCGDSDFGISTQSVIEIFLRTIKLGPESCLVQKRFFLSLLQSIVSVGKEVAKLDDSVLFSDYLFPLMHRLKMKERAVSSKHPSLPRRST